MSNSCFEPELLNELAESFLQRYRRGERPSLSEYTRKHPELAAQIEEYFPALMVMEEFGSVGGSPSGALPLSGRGPGAVPERLGEYRILRVLGRGGMGVVYEAVQESLGRHVALKVLPLAGTLNPGHLERFRREAKAAARLHHTNIVPVFGVGECQGIHYYAMQYIQGQGLDEVLREVRRLRAQKKPLNDPERITDITLTGSVAQGLMTGQFCQPAPREEAAASREGPATAPPDANRALADGKALPDAAGPAAPISESYSELTCQTDTQYFRGVVQLAIQAAEALEHAHRQGILHRDIKPSNLLLDMAGQVWVTDFGLAKVEESDEITCPGDIVGTLRYMAPERFQGQSDARGDVYSLGITLYELLTLRPAFEDSNRARFMERIARDEPLPLRKLDPHIPRDLETIVLKAIAKEPARRYQEAAHLAADLERFLADRPIRARRTPLLERCWRWCRRNPAVALTSGLATAALVAALVLTLALAIHQHHAAERLRAEQQQTLTALGQAQTQRQLADQATSRLLTEQDQTKKALEEAEKQRRLAERLSTSYAMHQGLNLCEQGDVALGLLWLAQSLKIAPDHAQDLQHAIRANLACWKGQCRPLKALLQHEDGVCAIAYSPDGKMLLTGGWDKQGRMWSAEGGARIGPLLWHSNAIWAVAISPDNRTALTAGVGGGQLWDLETGKPIAKRFHTASSLTAAAFSPRGDSIVTGDLEGKIQRWDARTAAFCGEVCSLGAAVRALAFSPDGQTILAGGDNRTAGRWNAVTGESRGPSFAHGGAVQCVAFNHQGSRLLTGSWDGTAQTWDAATGLPLGPPMQHQGQVYAVSFSADDRMILTGSLDGTAQIWDAATYRPLGHLLRCRGHISAAVFSPDGNTVATGGTENLVRLWDVSGPTSAEEQFPQQSRPVRSPNSRTVARSTVWSPSPRLPLRHVNSVRAVAISPDGRYLLTGSDDSSAQLWNLNTGTPKGAELRHAKRIGRIRAVDISPDGKMLLTGGFDQKARLWDPETGNPIGPPISHLGDVWAVSFSPDSTKFLTADAHDRVQCWDSLTSKALAMRFKHPGRVNALAWSPDGRMIVSAGQDGTALRWDALTGLPLRGPLKHADAVWAVTFNRDGRLIVTGSWDGTARLWDAATGTPKGEPFPHQAKVEAVALSPDGKSLVTGGLDGLARLWDVATRKQIGPAMKHEGMVLAAVFHPDGQRIVTGCGDCAAHVWSVPSPFDGSVREIVESTELLTGLHLEPGGAAVAVDARDWSKRYARRQHLALYSLQIALCPLHPEPYYRRGKLYADNGDLQKAFEDWTRALQLCGKDRDLELRLRMLRTGFESLAGRPQ